MSNFDKGTRVWTELGTGAVLTRRMAAPNYTEAASYCVMLDTKLAASQKPPFLTYSGTILPAEKVFPLNSEKLIAHLPTEEALSLLCEYVDGLVGGQEGFSRFLNEVAEDDIEEDSL